MVEYLKKCLNFNARMFYIMTSSNLPANTSKLHYHIIKFIVEKGYAPNVTTLAEFLDIEEKEVFNSLYALEDDHGVVLHPNRPEVWVIHPFSLAPTNFLVSCPDGEWWGNCAWCSLGVAALLDRDVTITTTIGAHGDRVDIHIKDGKIVEENFLVHFPVPMNNAWDNVIYTCSVMLVFETQDQIDKWCRRHHITKGDVQPLSKIWEFAKVWYGDHLNPNWKKWTTEEVKRIFDRFSLTGEIWKISVYDSRF